MFFLFAHIYYTFLIIIFLICRKEARDMLTDLAVRKLSPGDSSYTKLRRVSAESSPGSSPRRRRLTKTPSSEVQSSSLESMQKYSLRLYLIQY